MLRNLWSFKVFDFTVFGFSFCLFLTTVNPMSLPLPHFPLWNEFHSGGLSKMVITMKSL